MRPVTVVDRIVDLVAQDILRGAYAVSGRLPTLKGLAAEHEVTTPTAQRVVARLMELDLVEARQGSGIYVRDPTEADNLALLPLWLRALRQEPERAGRRLADFLELRRTLAVDMVLWVRRHKSEEALAVLAPLAAEAWEHAQNGDGPALMAIDKRINDGLTGLRGNLAITMVARRLDRLLEALPELQAAMYADPAANAVGMAEAAALLAHPSDEHVRGALTALFERIDAATVAGFVRILGGQP